MKTELLHFAGANNYLLPACIWSPEGPVRMVLQVIHGMTEHMGRYALLAEKLTAQGIAVACFDLRGHGQNPGDPTCAAFPETGWSDSLTDMHLFYQFLEGMFPGVPHTMLGFSLGSFLLRDYLSHTSDPVAAAIIAGSGTQPAPVLWVLKKIVRGQIKKYGFTYPAPLVQKLLFGVYNQKFKPNRTSSDWLTGDNDQLDDYLADPLCRKTISSGLCWILMDAIQRTGTLKALSSWPKDLPVLLLGGMDDPVGNMGKGMHQVFHLMQKAGLKKSRLLLLPGARHDILHEISSGAETRATQAILALLESTMV